MNELHHDTVRFGVLDSPDAPFAAQIARWELVEALGFDLLFAPDHAADFGNPSGPWFDGWVAVAAMATKTSRIRIGTLVSNPILRHPTVLAKQAAAVDDLCNGRLELGIGTGIADFDHAAVGVEYWSPKERVRRFVEYVQVVDELLASGGEPVSFAGRAYSTESRLAPDPVQRPRPPITIGGHSPTVLRVAAARAECWNTDLAPEGDVGELLALTRQHMAALDEACVRVGRDPATLRRSVLLIHACDAWGSGDALRRNAERFFEIGMRDFIVFWPGDDRRADIERAANDVIPRLRNDLSQPRP